MDLHGTIMERAKRNEKACGPLAKRLQSLLDTINKAFAINKYPKRQEVMVQMELVVIETLLEQIDCPETRDLIVRILEDTLTESHNKFVLHG